MEASGNLRESLRNYFKSLFGECRIIEYRALGKGAHGTGFLVSLSVGEERKDYVLKSIAPEGLGHDYPSDRAAVFLLALDNYGKLPRHVRALDVLSLQKDSALKPIGGGEEYFLLMERGEGVSYFKDLDRFSKKDRLDKTDKAKIRLMAEYLRDMHSVKKTSKTLYLRKLRDIIGHGECLMGVFDTYPDGVLSHTEMAEIEKKCIDWRAGLKGKYGRLSQIHGDFHPGNIWWGDTVPGVTDPLLSNNTVSFSDNSFKADSSLKSGLCLLDRSRGEWGEPADDVTALTINYVFFSIRHFNEIRGAYLEGFRLFYGEYLALTGDEEILEVVAPFYAFRGAVVANPVFYPELTPEQRRLIFRFVNRVLAAERFTPEDVKEYFI